MGFEVYPAALYQVLHEFEDRYRLPLYVTENGSAFDLCGYMVWSWIDNFEWTFGYSKRFGVIACDFETGARMTKSSGEWLRRVIDDNSI